VEQDAASISARSAAAPRLLAPVGRIGAAI
jgi:hypothetical protein